MIKKIQINTYLTKLSAFELKWFRKTEEQTVGTSIHVHTSGLSCIKVSKLWLTVNLYLM